MLKGLSDGMVESFFRSCLGRAKQLFELGPGFFDGVQVGRVRRQVKQLRTCGFDTLPYAFGLMGGEVVHHHCTTRSQGRTEEMVKVGEEDIRIGGRLDGSSRPRW